MCYDLGMKFEVRNVARVREASIVIDGVSVIAGPNGSGKSSIARGLCVFRGLLGDFARYVNHERARSLIVNCLGVKSRALPKLFRFFPATGSLLALWSGEEIVRQADALCSETFWEDGAAVYDYLAQYVGANGYGKEQKWEARKAEFVALYDVKLKDPLLEYLRRQNMAQYEQFVFERAFSRAYRGQLNAFGAGGAAELALCEDEAVAEATFEDGRCTRHSAFFRVASGTHYLETAHLLDEIGWRDEGAHEAGNALFRYVERCAPTWETYVRRPKSSNPTPEEAAEQEHRARLLERVNAVLKGRLAQQKDTLVFRDASGEAVRIPNLASGMKSMALIARAIENGWIAQGDVFIIDEPESNLHPEWQITFAEWLVALSRELDLRLLLNTHSPYFLRALECFSKSAGVGERFHAYLMEADRTDGEGVQTFSAHEVTHDIACIYKQMARPFDVLE